MPRFHGKSDFPHFNLMSKLLVVTLIVIFSSTVSFGQTPGVSTVVLKSGLVVKGKILKIDLTDKLVIELPSGGSLEIKMEDIEQLTLADSQPNAASSTLPYEKVKPQAIPFKEKGYYAKVDFGLPFGLDTYGDPSLNVSISMSGGHVLNRHLSLGLATGMDFYWWPNSVVNPLALEARGRFYNDNFTPYYSLQVGYGFLTSSEYWSENTKGGLFIAPGVGIISKKRDHTAWNLHLGFRSQTMQGEYEDWIWRQDLQRSVLAQIHEKIVYNRLELRFGFWFE
jgi:hypothetical protein